MTRICFAGNLLQTDTEIEAGVDKGEFVTTSFSGVDIEPISESELEYGISSNEKGSVMICDDFVESNRRLEGNSLQVAATESIELR